MTEAFVYDAIRTPRGKGKKDGSLYEVKPVNLLAGVLTELQRRNDFDTAQVDDVVMGVVSPVGEQGSVIAKTAMGVLFSLLAMMASFLVYRRQFAEVLC